MLPGFGRASYLANTTTHQLQDLRSCTGFCLRAISRSKRHKELLVLHRFRRASCLAEKKRHQELQVEYSSVRELHRYQKGTRNYRLKGFGRPDASLREPEFDPWFTVRGPARIQCARKKNIAQEKTSPIGPSAHKEKTSQGGSELSRACRERVASYRPSTGGQNRSLHAWNSRTNTSTNMNRGQRRFLLRPPVLALCRRPVEGPVVVG